jgi:hypothetical protein
MLIAGAFGALAASSSSPDYANATQVTDGSNMTQFNGSDTEAYYLNRTWASNNPEIRVQDPESNETIRTWTKSDLSETVNDSTNGTYAYRANFTEAHLEEIEMDSGENKSIRFQMVANASVDEANETYTNWTVYAENVEGRTTYRLGQTAASNDDLALETDGIKIETLGWHLFKSDYAEFKQTNVPINGSGSNVTLHYANSTSVDALDQSASDYSSGDWAKRTLVEVETTGGETVRMKAYKGSLPDDVDAQADSYALINEKQDTVKVHFGDDFDGNTKVDSLAVRTNDDAWAYVSFYQTKIFGFDSLDFTFDGLGGLLSVSGGITALSGLALAGRPEQNRAS